MVIITTSLPNILWNFSDKDLINELKNRDYVVPKKEYVKDLHFRIEVQNYIVDNVTHYEKYVKDMGVHALAKEIALNNITRFTEERLKESTIYRADVMMIAWPEKKDENGSDNKNS